MFLDVETTGLNPDLDEIIELALIRTENLEIKETFSTLVKPYRQIPRFITTLTGISSRDVESSPRMDELKTKISEFIRDLPIVAHNAGFDKAFLEKGLEKELSNPIFDTLEISRLFFPELASHSLENLVQSLGLNRRNHHRALSDARMLLDLLTTISKEKNKFSRSLLEFLRKITADVLDLDLVFGEMWYTEGSGKEKDIFACKQDSTTLELPFTALQHEQKQVHRAKPTFIETDNYEEALGRTLELLTNRRFIVSVYSEDVKNVALNFFKQSGFTVERFENPERFICPKKIMFYMQNTELLPKEYRLIFATIVTYLYKTGDVFIESAPPHIVKNPVLRALSYCEEEKITCSMSSTCPLKNKLKVINDSDVIITEHQFVISDERLREAARGRSLVFLEAYRIPQVLLSAKLVYSTQDIELLAKYENTGQEQLSDALFLFEKYPEGISEFSTEDLNKLKHLLGEDNPAFSRLLKKEVFSVSKKEDKTSLLGHNRKPKDFFIDTENIVAGTTYISRFNTLQEARVIREFAGITDFSEFSMRNRDFKNVLCVVPLYLHSPNNSEFPEELVNLLIRYSSKKTAVVFNSANLYREVYYLLRSKVEALPESDLNLLSRIEFMYYDNIKQSDYSELFMIRTPVIRIENDSSDVADLLSLYSLKNIVAELSSSKGSVIAFYIDGRFKNREFRTKYEDVFISFPLLIAREESLPRMLDNHRRRYD